PATSRRALAGNFRYGRAVVAGPARGESMTTIQTSPIEGQKPGTSGLRKKTRTFREHGFLENFVQSVFDATGGAAGKTLVLGGDGRFFGREAAQIILRMAAANGAARV